MDSQSANPELIQCNSCNRMTLHNLLFICEINVPIFDSTDNLVADYPEIWNVLQCRGCEGLVARVESSYPWANYEPEFNFYPERIVSQHRTKQYQKLPENLKRLYAEVVKSLNHNSLLLCTAGLRALIEGLCADRGIIEGPNEHGKIARNLEGKINSLQSIVPPNIVKNLHGLRFLGNQALHELEIPSKDDLELAVIIIEDIFNIVYDLDYRSQLLYDKIKLKKKESSEDKGPF